MQKKVKFTHVKHNDRYSHCLWYSNPTCQMTWSWLMQQKN